MLQAGLIRELRLQQDFTLQEAYTTPDGRRIRAIRYCADFCYERKTQTGWEKIVEDVKSRATRTQKLSLIHICLLWKDYPAISDGYGRLRRRKAASMVPRILHSERALAETGRSRVLSAGDSLPALTMAG